MSTAVKLSTLIETSAALNRIAATKGLPIKTSYALSQLLNKIGQELKIFNAVRNKLFTDLGEPVKDFDKDGKELDTGQRRIREENIPEFTKQIDSLLNTIITIDRKVQIEDLGEKTDITPGDLADCSYLFDE